MGAIAKLNKTVIKYTNITGGSKYLWHIGAQWVKQMFAQIAQNGPTRH